MNPFRVSARCNPLPGGEFRQECSRGIAPLNWPSGSIALSEKVKDAALHTPRSVEVIGHEHLLLELAENDLDLVQPGGMDRQPMDLDFEGEGERLDSGRQPLGGMSRAVVQDQVQRSDALTPDAGHEHSPKDLKFDEPLSPKTPRQRFASVDQQAGKELHGAFSLVAVAEVHRPAGAGGHRVPAGLAGLDGRLLVGADDDVALPGQPLRPLVEIQYGNRLLQKPRGGRLLPTAVLPGLDLVGLEPALNGGG